MAQNALMRPWNFEVANVGAFTQPVMQGIDAGYKDRQQAVENERQNKLMGFQEQRLGMEKARDARAAEAEQVKRIGQMANVVLMEQDPGRQALLGKQLLSSHPEMASALSRYNVDPNDHVTAAKFLAAQAGAYDPLGDAQKRAQTEATKANAAQSYASAEVSRTQMQQLRNQTPEARAAAAANYGLVRGTPEYNAFVISGQYQPKPDTVTLTDNQTVYQVGRDPSGNQTMRPIVQGKPKIDTATQKEIVETDETIASGRETLSNLDRALKLNRQAYSGLTAGIRGTLDNNTVGSKAGAATAELENVIVSSALSSLKATFGAAPTEGERKILLEVQGSVNQPAHVRERIFTEARNLAEKRIQRNSEKAKALRDGTYFKPEYQPSSGTPAPASRQRAVNPTTGQAVEFDGQKWVPVQ